MLLFVWLHNENHIYQAKLKFCKRSDFGGNQSPKVREEIRQICTRIYFIVQPKIYKIIKYFSFISDL
jgi:hypothetical protein